MSKVYVSCNLVQKLLSRHTDTHILHPDPWSGQQKLCLLLWCSHSMGQM